MKLNEVAGDRRARDAVDGVDDVGAGADLGYLTPMQSWSSGVGAFSPNFVVRFRAKDSNNKIEPFVTVGYTLFFRSGTASGFNFGSGVNYWLKDRVGLRFEVRAAGDRSDSSNC